jgi:hypothetical protein
MRLQVPLLVGLARASAEQLAAAVPAEQRIGCSAGHGAKGRRLYDWIRVDLAPPVVAGMARWLLVRRSQRDGELAFYACFAPATTPLIGLVRVAGARWAVEEGFEQAGRGRAGPLRGPQVAGLVPPHHVGAAGARVPGRHPRPGHQPRAGKGGRGRLTGELGLLPLTVPEVRRLLVALVWTTPVQPGLVLSWSRWRRRHQARARRAHYQRREPYLGR